MPYSYLNGNWSLDPPQISVGDGGFLQGATLVERLRTFGGIVFRLEDHLQRLHRSLEIVGWQAASLCAEVRQASAEFMSRNEPFVAAGDDWNLVWFITPGLTADAAQPTVCLHGHPLPFHNWAAGYHQGVAASLGTTRQVPASCWPAELKCRSRMHYYLADRAAAPAAQAILLDQDGFVGEGSTANVVASYHDRGLVTPRRTKVLPGVSQQVLYELAAAQGIAHLEDDITPDQLAAAEEIFFTSTSICLQPVTQLNNRPVGSGQPGPRYRQLLAAWSARVGVDISGQAQQFAQRRMGCEM